MRLPTLDDGRTDWPVVILLAVIFMVGVAAFAWLTFTDWEPDPCHNPHSVECME